MAVAGAGTLRRPPSLTGVFGRHGLPGRLAGPVAVVALQLIAFPMPAGVMLQGVVVGLLGALVAVGMSLVYRTNRVLNFAQVQLGLAPAALAVSLGGLRRLRLSAGGEHRTRRLGARRLPVELVVDPPLLPVTAADSVRRDDRHCAAARRCRTVRAEDLVAPADRRRSCTSRCRSASPSTRWCSAPTTSLRWCWRRRRWPRSRSCCVRRASALPSGRAPNAEIAPSLLGIPVRRLQTVRLGRRRRVVVRRSVPAGRDPRSARRDRPRLHRPPRRAGGDGSR